MVKVSYVTHCPGHLDSRGERAEWCVKDHKTNKILKAGGVIPTAFTKAKFWLSPEGKLIDVEDLDPKQHDHAQAAKKLLKDPTLEPHLCLIQLLKDGWIRFGANNTYTYIQIYQGNSKSLLRTIQEVIERNELLQSPKVFLEEIVNDNWSEFPMNEFLSAKTFHELWIPGETPQEVICGAEDARGFEQNLTPNMASIKARNTTDEFNSIDALVILEDAKKNLYKSSSGEDFLTRLNTYFSPQKIYWEWADTEQSPLTQGFYYGGEVVVFLNPKCFEALQTGNQWAKWNMFLSEVDATLTHELVHVAQNPDEILLKGRTSQDDLESPFELEAHADSAYVELQSNGWSDDRIHKAIGDRDWNQMAEDSESFSVYHEYLYGTESWCGFLKELEGVLLAH